MLTFLVCLTALVIAYFTYGRYLERVAAIDPAHSVPSETLFDGVDYVPMPRWRVFLIQLLNIAGTGPIFGAILGAAFGPVAFLWITLGGIFMGAMHDFLSGVMLVRNDGLSIPEVAGRYLGTGMRQFMRLFSVVLLVLVGAVFLLSPADILSGMVPSVPHTVWVWLILAYYFVATLLPIDKIIGKIYPIFGAILLFSAVGVFAGIFIKGYPLVNLWDTWNTANYAFGDYFGENHFIPIFFITVACGILSGFHSTQTAIVSRTVGSEKEGRNTFYNMMVLEGFIAMVWAAGAMGVYALGLQEGNPSLATDTIGIISRDLLGSVGGIIALLGVIVLPVTSGDTALRALRLTVADSFHIDQSSGAKRIGLSAVIFALVAVILVFAKMSPSGFNTLWRYFAWSNQTLSLFAFAAISVWLFENKKGQWVWIPLIPAVFYAFVTFTYLCNAKIGFNLPWGVSYGAGAAFAVAYLVVVVMFARRRAANAPLSAKR